MADRLEKNVAIARSGVQFYLKSELPALKVGPIPDKFQDKKVFAVYRPATLIAANKDKFTKRPFIYTHKAYVDNKNFSSLAQGWTGDSASVEMNQDGTEAVVRTELQILGDEAMRAYDRGEREVSPMYFGEFKWMDDETTAPDGQTYQIIMDSMSEVNHVALVPQGRGGKDAAILDHAGKDGRFLTGLWRFIKKSLLGVKDEERGYFRKTLEAIAKARLVLTSEDIESRIQALWECVNDLPSTDESSLLGRYLADARILKEKESDEEAMQFVDIVSSLYEKLDEQSMQEILNTQKGETMDGKSKDAEPEKKEEEKKEEKKPEDGKSKDEGDNGAKILGLLEEILTHLKGKSNDDAPEIGKDKEEGKSKDEDPAEKKEDKKDEKDEKGASKDAAPWAAIIEEASKKSDDPAMEFLNSFKNKEKK